jgi:hypothetical protein
MERREEERTEHQNIQDQDNEAEESSTGAVFPGVAVHGRGECLFGHCEGEEEEIEEE